MVDKGLLKRASYRAVGPQLTIDTLAVDIDVDGHVYTHQLPNEGWGYNTPALMFMAYADIKPTDFDGGQYVFGEGMAIPVEWNKQQGQYLIARKPLMLGSNKLSEVDWFDPEGDVWNSGEALAFGGMSTEPGTGNKAGVDI